MAKKTKKRSAKKSAAKRTKKAHRSTKKTHAKRAGKKRGGKRKGKKSAKRSTVASHVNVSSLAAAFGKKKYAHLKRAAGSALKKAKGKDAKTLKALGNRLAPKKRGKKRGKK